MSAARNSRVLRISSSLIAVCLLSFPADAKYGGGNGTPGDPYQIATAADLIALGDSPEDYDKHFILTANIDLDPNLPSRKVFVKAIVGTFTGVFDGGGHTISHLTITGVSGLGLFGGLEGPEAEIKDLGLVDVNITGSGDYVGGLVGANHSGNLSNCYSTGSVSGGQFIGGLVGGNGGEVTNSYSTSTVSGSISVGGLVGQNRAEYNDVSVNVLVDGLVAHCYSTGLVIGTENVGGLVGYSDYADIKVSTSFWDMETSGLATSAGGTGKTTAEMQTAHTFLLWGTCGNEGIWTIDEGRDYPRLWWQNRPGEPIAFAPSLQDLITGEGTEQNPYLIHTAEELNLLGLFPCNWDKHFKLMADIDLSGFNGKEGRPAFNIIGAGADAFAGIFDGNGHAISHLTIVGNSHLGLFGYLSGEVKDLGVVDVNTIGSGGAVGGLVGWNYGGDITRCYSTGTVTGGSTIGGLVGSNEGDVTHSYSTSAVTGKDYVGGLVGCNTGSFIYDYQHYGGTVNQCYSSGPVKGAEYVGSEVGGLVGYGSPTVVTASFWDMQTSGQSRSAGGTGKTTAEMQTASTFLDAGWDFVDEIENGTHEVWQTPEPGGYPVLAILSGYAPPQLQGRGTLEDPYLISNPLELGAMTHYSPTAHYRLVASIDLVGIRWSVPVIRSLQGSFDGNGLTISNLTITGAGYLGLFGRLESRAQVKDLGIVDVIITASSNDVGAGGLVGENWGDVTQCFSAGSISGIGRYSCSTGGLVGRNIGDLTRCYSHVSVSNTGQSRDTGYLFSNFAGGLVGRNTGDVTHCYSTGAVSGNSFVGGLVGGNWYGSIYGRTSSSFWDTKTSGQATSAGGEGKTTVEMQTAKTFLEAGWDFVGETANGTEDIWWILEGKDYPRLWWERAIDY